MTDYNLYAFFNTQTKKIWLESVHESDSLFSQNEAAGITHRFHLCTRTDGFTENEISLFKEHTQYFYDELYEPKNTEFDSEEFEEELNNYISELGDDYFFDSEEDYLHYIEN